MNKVEILGAKETLYIEHLDNGLDIYMIPKNDVKNFYVTLNVKYGSIYTNYKWKKKSYEDPKGIAHYLEHLMFNMPDGDAFNYYGKLGSSANAYTTNEYTCYEIFSNSKFKENLSSLLKMVYTPYFKKELVNKERGIIIEEIKMYEDDPATSLLYNLYNNLFINDERKYLISGTVDDVKSIKLDDIERVYEAFYQPSNMFLVITGNFNPLEAVAITSDVMSNFKFEVNEIPIVNLKNEPFEVSKNYIIKNMDVIKDKVSMGFKIPKNNFKSLKLSNIELRLYINIIMQVNFGNTSIINEEMKSNEILNKNINFRLEETKDYYILIFTAETDYPDYFVNRIKSVMDKIYIDDENIIRKTKVSISNLIWVFDNIESVNDEIIDDIIRYNVVISDIYQIYKSLNIETALKVINKLDKKLLTVSIIKSND